MGQYKWVQLSLLQGKGIAMIQILTMGSWQRAHVHLQLHEMNNSGHTLAEAQVHTSVDSYN